MKNYDEVIKTAIIGTAERLVTEKAALAVLEDRVAAQRSWVETLEKDLAFYLGKGTGQVDK